MEYSLHSQEKPSKSNLCAKYSYIDSWLMAHIALKSDLKSSQVKARKREELLNYDEWKFKKESTNMSHDFMRMIYMFGLG